MNRRNGVLVGAFALIVVGFILLKPPKPIIVIAAEKVVDLGGYTITNTILSAWVVIILMAIGTFFLYRRLRDVEAAMVPRGLQNLIEGLLEAFFGVVAQVAGEKNGRRFFPVVATIFIFLLFANWFGLFPWNNAIGQVEDVRFHYLEELEENAEDVIHDLDTSPISIAAVNNAFSTVYLDPLPIENSEQDEANEAVAAILAGRPLGEAEAAVRAEFSANPIPDDTPPAELLEAIEERMRTALESTGLEASAEALEHAIALNLPLSVNHLDQIDIAAPVIEGSIIPLKAEEFEFDPFIEELVLATGADGGFSEARLFDSTAGGDEENRPPADGEFVAPVTINMAHLGILLKMEKEGVDPDSDTVGEIFPFFRSIATDLNLPLAIALWSFIFVQFWGMQSLGVGNNFGKFIGVGRAAVVKGPIGVAVGLLEIISELSRIISFTFRLFGNIFAGEIVLFMAAFLVPFVAASVFYGLEIFVGFIQAFVFAMLTLVFAVTAISHGEHEEDEHGEEGAGH